MDTMSVSYTHLDVYKRQAVQVNGVNLVDPIYIHTLDDNQTIRVHFTNLVQYDACLLYTSRCV